MKTETNMVLLSYLSQMRVSIQEIISAKVGSFQEPETTSSLGISKEFYVELLGLILYTRLPC